MAEDLHNAAVLIRLPAAGWETRKMLRGMFVGFCPADYLAEVRPAASVQVTDGAAKDGGRGGY